MRRPIQDPPLSTDPSPVVLVVDDDEMKRYATVRSLQRADYQVWEAALGEDALRLAEKQPDLILLDVVLPDLSGFEVCKQLKAQPSTSAIPVIHLSGTHVEEADRVRGLTGGAEGYLVTPVGHEVLLATVSAWLRYRKADRERQRLLELEQAARAIAEESERRYRTLSDSIPHLVWVTAADGTLEYLNRRFTEYTGADPSRSWEQALHPSDAAEVTALWLASVEQGVPFETEHRLRRQDGEYRWHLVRAVPTRNPAGQIDQWVGTASDVHDRRLADEKAAQVARTREQFVGMLGHDLRTPLTSISLAAQQLLKAPDVPAPHQKLVSRLSHSAERMRRMISELLDFTRIGLGGALPLARRRVDLRETVGQVIQEFELANPGREIHLRVAGDLIGEWDPDRLAQVAANLIGNALQHGRPLEAPVEVELRLEGELAQVAVTNHGPKLPADLIGRLFEPYRQGIPDSDVPRAGLGLGLYIALNIVQGHGGSIEVVSTDTTITFTVLLPLKLDADR